MSVHYKYPNYGVHEGHGKHGAYCLYFPSGYQAKICNFQKQKEFCFTPMWKFILKSWIHDNAISHQPFKGKKEDKLLVWDTGIMFWMVALDYDPEMLEKI